MVEYFISNKNLNRYLFCLIIICNVWFFLTNTALANEQLSLYIETTEGSEPSKRRADKLKKYFHLKQCPIQKISYGNQAAASTNSDFIFIPLQPPLPDRFVKLADINIVNGEKLSASIVVRKSTAIKDVSNLDGIYIAFLSPDSVTGYKLQQRIFKDAGVAHDEKKITYALRNVAAVALLLHKDVFAAAIATPLAKKWAKLNGLLIVATSEEVEAGGLWVNQSVSTELIENCSKAFGQLSKKGINNKYLMKFFPAWVESFSTK